MKTVESPGRLAGLPPGLLRAASCLALGFLTACGGGGGSPSSASTGSSGSAGGNASGSGTSGVACGVAGSGTTNTAPTGPVVNQAYQYNWTCNTSARVLSGNGIPSHAVTAGRFATPVSAQTVSATYTLAPAVVSSAGAGTGMTPVGFALNSVKFDPGTAGTCTDTGVCDAAGNGGAWRMEALAGSFTFGTDQSNGHVQPNGQYHYHGVPEGLVAQLQSASSTSMTLVGWAADGFPVYARYGYINANDAKSGTRAMQSSWKTKAAPDPGRPATSLIPMGSFTQDWEYRAGSGDLDECNGRTAVTPDFPQGIYHYYITDSFPFIQRCVKGTPTAVR